MSSPPGGLILAQRIMTLRARWGASSLRDKAKICVLDYLAAALAGAASSTCRISEQVLSGFGAGPCTRIGLAGSGSAAGAALHNGLIGHAEELDDSHRYVSGLHLGVTIIPAALALAEDLDSSGDDLLCAVACGYEAAGRLCRCCDKEHRARGFHSTGTFGPFGAAAACSVLLRADAQQLAHALGIAASSAAGIFAFLEDGATVKHFHAGRAALDGYTAARLAAAGMTGPAPVFEAREGFFAAYATGADMHPLGADLGQAEIECAYHKLHSACGHSFPAIDAALELRRVMLERKLPFTAIERLEYASYHAAVILANPTPKTVPQARFSLPFMIAMALLHGRTTRHDFAEAMADAAVGALCRVVMLREDAALTDAFPRLRAGVLAATLSSGETLSFRVDAPRGMPDNPVSLADIEAKFEREAAPLLGADTSAAIRACVSDLDRLRSIHELTALLRR